MINQIVHSDPILIALYKTFISYNHSPTRNELRSDERSRLLNLLTNPCSRDPARAKPHEDIVLATLKGWHLGGDTAY